MRIPLSRPQVAGLLVALTACGGDRAVEGPAFVQRDSAGVHIVESRVPVAPGVQDWLVGEPRTVIGGGESGDLYEVAGAVRLHDGRFVVADGGSSEVRFYHSDGALQMRVGGRGEGPGEFSILQSLGLSPGDTIWAYDFALQRFTHITADGSVTALNTLEPRLPAGVPVGRLDDGSFVMAQMWGTTEGGITSGGLTRELAAYVRYGADGRLIDTVTWFPGREVFLEMEGGRAVMGVAPFARSASHALAGEHLLLGDQVAHEVLEYDTSGAVRRRLRWAGPTLDVTDGDISEWRERQVASAPPDERPSLRAYLSGVPVPEQKPAYGRLLWDPMGFLWVGGYDHVGQEPARWDVLDARGRWLGSLEMPARFRPLQIWSDGILGVARDQLDVERVELRLLRR